MHIKFLSQIKDVEKHSWDSLNHESYPFLSFDFLNALEESGCVSERTGWQPFHVTLWKEESLIGAMPLYLKNNSQGEFVFDYNGQMHTTNIKNIITQSLSHRFHSRLQLVQEFYIPH